MEMSRNDAYDYIYTEQLSIDDGHFGDHGRNDVDMNYADDGPTQHDFNPLVDDDELDEAYYVVATQGRYLRTPPSTPRLRVSRDDQLFEIDQLFCALARLLVRQLCRFCSDSPDAPTWPVSHTPPEVQSPYERWAMPRQDQDDPSDMKFTPYKIAFRMCSGPGVMYAFFQLRAWDYVRRKNFWLSESPRQDAHAYVLGTDLGQLYPVNLAGPDPVLLSRSSFASSGLSHHTSPGNCRTSAFIALAVNPGVPVHSMPPQLWPKFHPVILPLPRPTYHSLPQGVRSHGEWLLENPSDIFEFDP